MRKILAVLLILATSLPLTGCETLKAKWRDGTITETLLIGAREVGIYVGSQVLSLAVSGRDFATKKDYLQGLTEALWSNSGKLADPATVYEIARAWTPKETHWEKLASTLTLDFAEKNPQSKEEVMAVLSGYAEGIYAVTAEAEATPIETP